MNKIDNTDGRKVWFQYWDTCLTHSRSYYARLNYVHHNPEKHGLVRDAQQYPWCSKAWFMREAQPAYQKTVFSFRYDKINVQDEF